MSKFNPFRPGSIVTPGMFAGRLAELEGTERALNQTKHGNPHHFLILGERGIGKSSLLLSLDYVAKSRLKSLDGEEFDFLTINVVLEPSNTYHDIIHKVGVSNINPIGQAAKVTWDFDEEFYRHEILLRLSEFSVKKIKLAIDVSHPYATLIKHGLKIPHPRHWMALAELVGIRSPSI